MNGVLPNQLNDVEGKRAVSKILDLMFPSKTVPDLFSKADIAKLLMILIPLSERSDNFSFILEELLMFIQDAI